MFDPKVVADSIKEVCRKEFTVLTSDSMVLCFRNHKQAIIHILDRGVTELLDSELIRLEAIAEKQKTPLTTRSFLFNVAVFMEDDKSDYDLAMMWAVYWSEYHRRKNHLTDRPIVLCMDVTKTPMTTGTIDNSLLFSQ